MVAVDNILAGRVDKSNIWSVNTEQEYHEEASDNVKSTPSVNEETVVVNPDRFDRGGTCGYSNKRSDVKNFVAVGGGCS